MTAVLDRPGQIGAERQENAPVMPERAAGPFPGYRLRRELSRPGLAWRQFRRAPATICYLAAVWVAGLVTGSIAHGPPRWLSGQVGAGLPSLGHGCWWTPLSAALWAPGPGGYLAVTVLGLVILAPAERRIGAARTCTTLLASQAAGLLLAAGLVKLAGLAREPWLGALSGETAVGALPGVLGVGFALSGTLTPLWRRHQHADPHPHLVPGRARSRRWPGAAGRPRHGDQTAHRAACQGNLVQMPDVQRADCSGDG